jgi:hypothetical protein
MPGNVFSRDSATWRGICLQGINIADEFKISGQFCLTFLIGPLGVIFEPAF